MAPHPTPRESRSRAPASAVSTRPRETGAGLTERQRREVAYHRDRAARLRSAELGKSMTFDVLQSARRRWWNAYWHTYSRIRGLALAGKKVLVVGCGFGHDAILLSAVAGEVHAFDLSPDSLEIARRLAQRVAPAPIHFQPLPAESLSYPDDSFDLILAIDILHHVDIPRAVAELRRVARPGGIMVADEIYTHSWLERLRRSRLVDGVLYPRLVRWVYQTNAPYITDDERKLDERDVQHLRDVLAGVEVDYFNLFVGRLVPDRSDLLAKLDRTLLRASGPAGRLLANRLVLTGTFRK